MMDTHTELAVKRYFESHTEMECDKVQDNGSAYIITFTTAQAVIEEYNNACDFTLYMPI